MNQNPRNLIESLPQSGKPAEYARIVAVHKGKVDVIKINGTAIIHDVQLTGDASPARDDIVQLQKQGLRYIAMAQSINVMDPTSQMVINVANTNGEYADYDPFVKLAGDTMTGILYINPVISAMGDPSYSNPYGSGYRVGQIIIESNAFNANTADRLDDLIDNDLDWNLKMDGSAAGKWVIFTFPTLQNITEMDWGGFLSFSNGTWQIQGSNDKSTWTVIQVDSEDTFTWYVNAFGSYTPIHMAGNANFYKYYKMVGVSGTVGNGMYPYFYHVNFKTAGGTGLALSIGLPGQPASFTVTNTGDVYIGGILSLAGNLVTLGSIVAAILESTATATGEPPIVLHSEGLITHLNADLLDWYHASKTPAANTIPVADSNGYLSGGWLSPSTNYVPYTGATQNVNLGVHHIIASMLESTATASGDSPFTVISEHVVTHLNADMVDGKHASEIVSVPPGGTTDQVLAKASNTDGDTHWETMDLSDYVPYWGATTDVDLNGHYLHTVGDMAAWIGQFGRSTSGHRFNRIDENGWQFITQGPFSQYVLFSIDASGDGLINTLSLVEPDLPPLIVASEALVTNLNADMVDGKHIADIVSSDSNIAEIKDRLDEIEEFIETLGFIPSGTVPGMPWIP